MTNANVARVEQGGRGGDAKQLQRGKYFPVPGASPKDAKGGDQS